MRKGVLCVCDLVFIIPLQAARRAMAAVVGFSICPKNPGRPAQPVTVAPSYQKGVLLAVMMGNHWKLTVSRSNIDIQQ